MSARGLALHSCIVKKACVALAVNRIVSTPAPHLVSIANRCALWTNGKLQRHPGGNQVGHSIPNLVYRHISPTKYLIGALQRVTRM